SPMGLEDHDGRGPRQSGERRLSRGGERPHSESCGGSPAEPNDIIGRLPAHGIAPLIRASPVPSVGKTIPRSRWPPWAEPFRLPTTTWAWSRGSPPCPLKLPAKTSTSTLLRDGNLVVALPLAVIESAHGRAG